MEDDFVGGNKSLPADKSTTTTAATAPPPPPTTTRKHSHPQGEGHSNNNKSAGGGGFKKQQQGDQQQTSAAAAAVAAAGGNKNNNKKYAVKKRPPPKEVPSRPNDVFITEKSNFQAQISKCQRLFDGDHSEVYLHGLGSAIPRAINLAVELKKFYHGTVDYSVNTSTVKLIDDLIPLDDATPPSQQTRKVSCVDIRVFRTVKVP